MNKDKILDFLFKRSQIKMLTLLKELPKESEELLLEDIYKYTSLYQEGPQKEKTTSLSPLKKCEKTDFKSHRLIGLDSVKKQEVGCLVFAAGEGSRFGLNKAKGLFCLDGKSSLISDLCQWILAYEMSFNIKVPLLLLVSSKNKQEIIDHFEENNFFKLDRRNIFFIEQADYPLLDEKHQWFLDHENKIAKAPNGNGDFLEALRRSGTLKVLEEQDIKYLQVFFIDNPLIDPLDPNLLGFLINQKLDAALHVFERDDLTEKVGVICEDNGRSFVIDYMQIDQDSFVKAENRRPVFSYANSGHFCVSINSLISLANRKIKLPYHWVWKKVNGQTYAWKAEKFAFDIFPYLNCKSLCYEKNKTFAPLKTIEDVENVKSLLADKKREIYREVYNEIPKGDFTIKIKDMVSYLEKI